MAIEKLTTRLKNKTWTNPQIKNHKKKPKTQTDQTTNTTQKSRTHAFKILDTICRENYEPLHWFK
jgi:hypothetical protein